jgi:hypothetical protein
MAVTIGTASEVRESVAQITIISSARLPVQDRMVMVQLEAGAYDADGKLVGPPNPIGEQITARFSDLMNNIYTFHDANGTAHTLTGAQLAEALSDAAYKMRADDITRRSILSPPD